MSRRRSSGFELSVASRTRVRGSEPGPRLFASRHHPAIQLWLWVIAVMITAMVLVGGVTRLTGSGLSITEWRPVTGTLPPLTRADWEAEFEKYRGSPQFVRENFNFTLEDFQSIYWWEWGHRLLGRVIGFTVLVPFLFFWRRKLISPWLTRRVLLLLVLGGAQGLLGWLMVQSGLVHEPRVSHYRLAAHLMTALLTLSITIWTALEVGHGQRTGPVSRKWWAIVPLAVLLPVQLTWGAFVAGLRAGLVFPTFPKMGEDWVPPASLYPGSLWAAAVDNAVLVQLIHRWLGALVVLAAVLPAFTWPKARPLVGASRRLIVFAIIQFALGAFTVLGFATAPVFWGALHQAGAVALLTAAVIAGFHARRGPS